MKRALLLSAVVGIFFGGAVWWMSTDRSFAEEGFDAFSVENTGGSGLSIAFEYLQRTGHHAMRLEEPVTAALPRDAVVIRAGSLAVPQFAFEETKPRSKKDEKKKKERPKKKRETVPSAKLVSPLLDVSEEEWVRGGGRLVLATTSDVGPLKLRGLKRGDARKVFPLWPQLTTLAAPTPRVIVASSLPPRMHALFTIGDAPAIARETIGRGEVIVVAIPEVLENDALRRRGSLQFLQSLAPANRPIYFDETIHGFDNAGGAISLMKQWSLGPFLLLLALAALLYFWRHATRVGPAEDDHRETRSDAVDLVRSLGTLYTRSMSDEDALAMYRDTLVRTVAAQTGLRGDALYRRVADLTQHDAAVTTKRSRRMPRAVFRRHLDAINEAFRKLEHGRITRAAGELHANHR